MRHYIITSSDGSNTMKLEEFDECYHSTNGAFAEACHIYIQCGLEHLWHKINSQNRGKIFSNSIVIYDIGIGTALNCISTLLWQQSLLRNNNPAPHIHYIGIEKYPITLQEAMQLNFPQHICLMQNLLYYCREEKEHFKFKNINESRLFSQMEIDLWFKAIHTAEWGTNMEIAHGFTLTKINGDITECRSTDFRSALYPNSPSVVYYDTFSPATQPELWEKNIFEEIFTGVNNQSVLTTYCSKGIGKQALREVGFNVERLPGPPGKRHILRATKQS